jgi:L-lactate dehydrogenase complex protein LldE
MKVQLFIPCFVDQLYPQTGMNMVKLLEKAGCTVSYNPKQTCCGQPAYNAGYVDECRDVSTKFVKDFSGSEYIVSPSGSCTGFIRNSFEEIFDKTEHTKDAANVSFRSFEITEFLLNIAKFDDFGATLNGKATYHDACGALRECGIKEGPRQLLSKVKGLELIEMKEQETCCGFGGTFSVKFEPISVGMAQTKVQSAVDTGAKYMLSTDVSCLMHIDGYIRKNNIDMQTMHVVDVLASGWQ